MTVGAAPFAVAFVGGRSETTAKLETCCGEARHVPVSVEKLVPPIAANLTDGFRSQVPACGDARRFPDRVIDLCKENV
jgi:hypothetical protein